LNSTNGKLQNANLGNSSRIPGDKTKGRKIPLVVARMGKKSQVSSLGLRSSKTSIRLIDGLGDSLKNRPYRVIVT